MKNEPMARASIICDIPSTFHTAPQRSNLDRRACSRNSPFCFLLKIDFLLQDKKRPKKHIAEKIFYHGCLKIADHRVMLYWLYRLGNAPA